MKVKVISPEGQVFSGTAYAVTLPGEKGRFQVLHMHAPIVSILSKGDVVIRSKDGFAGAEISDRIESSVDGDAITIEVSSGAVKSAGDEMIILVD